MFVHREYRYGVCIQPPARPVIQLRLEVGHRLESRPSRERPMVRYVGESCHNVVTSSRHILVTTDMLTEGHLRALSTTTSDTY